jgi:hypothetical protein
LYFFDVTLEVGDESARKGISGLGSVEKEDADIARVWSGLILDFDR